MAGKKATKRGKGGDLSEEDNGKKQKKDVPEPDKLLVVPDEFNHNMLVTKDDICVMCRGGHEVGVKLKEKFMEQLDDEEDADNVQQRYEPDSILDVNGVWASKYSLLRKSQRAFVHFYCALYSPQAAFNGKSWCNLSRETYRGRGLTCTSCGQRGATLGCLDSRCNVVTHIPCAVKLGFWRKDTLAYLCNEHQKVKVQKELTLDQEMACDVANGREPVPVTCSNKVDDATIRSVIEHYTPVNVDGDAITVNSRSVTVDCCSCEGLCDDIRTCACLAFGRNYTFAGGLVPGTTRRILECNWKCSCSIRRCTNRVVEKGPTARLEIFRINSTNSPAAAPRTWGVRTLDAIPRYAFVCEVAGQYVLGRSADPQAGDKQADRQAKEEEKEPSDQPMVADALLRDPAVRPDGSAGASARYTARLMPVNGWDAALTVGDACEDPITWALRQECVAAAEDGDEGSGSARLLTATELLQAEESYEQVQRFLQGQICIDSRKFGNVGSFIRHKRIRPAIAPAAMAAASAASALHSAAATVAAAQVAAFNEQGAPAAAAPEDGPMLLRRLVYNNKKDNTAGLRLALFAARDIAAGSELLI